MHNPLPRWLAWAGALLLATSLSGCGYNEFQRLDEQSKSAWSEVLNQYQRRADLIPNIVATVKGEANFEQETLTKVIEARAKATSIQATPELINDPTASTWEVRVAAVDGRFAVELVPRRFVDPRFTYRRGDVPARQRSGTAAAFCRAIDDARSTDED